MATTCKAFSRAAAISSLAWIAFIATIFSPLARVEGLQREHDIQKQPPIDHEDRYSNQQLIFPLIQRSRWMLAP